MKTLSFEHEGRALEARMVPHEGGFVCHVWEGDRRVSSVPYVLSETQVLTATEEGDLEQVLDEALAKVREAVLTGELLV